MVFLEETDHLGMPFRIDKKLRPDIFDLVNEL
jgi:hypothetical protein